MCVATLFASTPTLHSSNDISSLTVSSSGHAHQSETSSLLPLSDLSLNQSTFDPSQFDGQPNSGDVNKDFLKLKPLQKYSIEFEVGKSISSLKASGNSLIWKPTEYMSRNTSVSVTAEGRDRPLNSLSTDQTEPSPFDTSGNIAVKERKKAGPQLMSMNVNNTEHSHSSESRAAGGLHLESSLFLFLNLTAALTSPDLLSDSPQAIETSSLLNPLTTALLCPSTPTRSEWVNDVGMNKFVCSLKDDFTFEPIETNEEGKTAKQRYVLSYHELPVNPLSSPSPSQSCISNSGTLYNAPKPSSPYLTTTPTIQYHSDASFVIDHETDNDRDCNTEMDFDTCTSEASTITHCACSDNYCNQVMADGHLYEHSPLVSPSAASEFISPLVSMDTFPTAIESWSISMVTRSPFLTAGTENNNFTLVEAVSFFARSVLAF